MKKSILNFLAFGIIVALISSCSSSSDLTSTSVIKKRRYLKGYQVDIKGSQKADKKEHIATAQMEPLETKTDVPEQKHSAELAQASVSNTITDADVKQTSVFDAPPKTEKPVVANEKTKTTFNLEEHQNTKSKNKYLRKNLSTSMGTPVPQETGAINLALYVILAIILPPLAVGLLYGIGVEFLLSILLTILFWVPGIIYALIMVFKKA